MTNTINTIIYPVEDTENAKALFTSLLGVEPSTDEPYYVGYDLGEQQIGLDPNGHEHGMTPYYHVDDIEASLQSLLDAGAQTEQEVEDIGGGGLSAVVKDQAGNIIGLRQDAQ